jgi:hypothetical protein
MCQLTFLSGDPTLVKAYLINLTILNSNDGNRDGFGLFEYPANKVDGIVWKNEKNGSSVVLDNDFYDILDGFTKPKLNIMSHVRSASRGFAINYDNTHPFRIDYLILAHNGTLEAENTKFEIKDRIDSYWFLHRLAKIVNKTKLTEAHIVEAMKDFRGKFAFLIGDLLNPEILWIVRGKAPLHYTKLLLDKEEVMFLINTDKINLGRLIAPYFLKVITGKTYEIEDPIEFDEESIYKYNIRSGSLVKTTASIIERPTIITIGSVTAEEFSKWSGGGGRSPHTGFVPQHHTSFPPSQKYINEDLALEDLAAMAAKFGLTTLELNLAHLLTTNEALIFATPESIKYITEVFMQFDNSFTTSKLDIWNNIVKEYKEKKSDPSKRLTVLDVYIGLNLKFPYFMNSKNELKHVLNRIEKRSNNRKKLSKLVRN